MQCCAAVWATYRKQQTPQLWMEGTGKRCGFFCSLKLPYLNTMSQQVCRHFGCLFFGFIVLLCLQSSIDISVRITLRMYTIVTIVSFCQTNHWVEFWNKSSYFFTNVFFYFPIFWGSFATWHPALDKSLSTGQWFTPGIASSNVWTIDFPFFLDEGWCIWRVLHCNYYSGDP